MSSSLEEFLALDLDAVTVTYTSSKIGIGNSVRFSFVAGGPSADVVSQDLPFGLVIDPGEPITVLRFQFQCEQSYRGRQLRDGLFDHGRNRHGQWRTSARTRLFRRPAWSGRHRLEGPGMEKTPLNSAISISANPAA